MNRDYKTKSLMVALHCNAAAGLREWEGEGRGRGGGRVGEGGGHGFCI